MKLKIITGVSLLIFFIFTTSLFTAGLISYGRQKDNKLAGGGTGVTSNEGGAVDGQVVLSLETVSKHATADDCWLIIDSNVYDVTAFVNVHPGGALLVSRYCGKDATNAFNSRDRNPPEDHSSFARNLLRSYYLGPLGKNPVPLAFPANTGQNASTPSGSLVGTSGGTKQISVVIDMNEVAKHNTLQNCWLIISGKVYDVTSFITQHPGGANEITPFCGKDATTAFRTKNSRGNDHSGYAYSLLNNYLIANLGSSVPLSQTAKTVSLLPTNTPNSVPLPPPQNNLSLTSQEVATHNTLQNCWLIISGKVYDVTSYISQHPGGVNEIVSNCGKDATTAFQTHGGRGSNHSANAYNLLNNYYIGSLGTSIPVNPTSVPGSGSTSNPTSVPGFATCPSNIPQSICTKYSGSTISYKSGKYEDDGGWEGEVIINGSCRHIKTNSSGTVTSDESC